jgi:hypothetical protein
MFRLIFIAPITVAAALTSFNPLASAALPTYDAIAIDFNLTCRLFKLSEAGDSLGSCGVSPAIRRATGELVNIPTLPGYSACTATDMNRDVKRLVGSSNSGAVYWTHGGRTVLPTVALSDYTELLGISDSGLAMGYYQPNQGDTTPFVWSPTGEWADVSTLIAPESLHFEASPYGCYDMNAVGQLICEISFNGAVRQLLLTPR